MSQTSTLLPLHRNRNFRLLWIGQSVSVLGSNISYLGPLSAMVRNDIYRPYVAHLKQIRDEIGGIPATTFPVPEHSIGGPPSLTNRLLARIRLEASRWAGHYVRTPSG